jgi:hypothetical protein
MAIAKPGRFLMLVKTYPSPSTKYGETVCCAGIDAETREWIRMYPVNFRSLDEFAKFRKWQFVEAAWGPSQSDGRLEQAVGSIANGSSMRVNSACADRHVLIRGAWVVLKGEALTAYQAVAITPSWTLLAAPGALTSD